VTPATSDKLAKLIPLLASDKDGEVLGAVGAIKRVLASNGSDLHRLAEMVTAPSLDSESADAAWELYYGALADKEMLRTQLSRDREELRRLRADNEQLCLTQARRQIVGALRARSAVQNGRAVQTGHDTASSRREAVLSILRAEGASLSDRDIASCVGVSPQTVNTWRKRLRAGGAS
jgi:flagellar hook-length control protein FliK